MTGGFEAVRAMDLPDNAQRIAEEAVALLTRGGMPVRTDDADRSTRRRWRCRCTSPAAIPIELDRVLGMEASFAGTSFLTLDKLDTLRYGSEIVNIDADATAPGGLGTFGFDDEGVPAQNVPIVSGGRFVGYLTSRETAPIIGRRSMGSSRASGWNVIPLIRMTNVNLRPGEAGTLDDLIADTDDGLLRQHQPVLEHRRPAAELPVRHRRSAGASSNGQLAEMVKNPTYTGITPEFWGSCDAICGDVGVAAVGRPELRQG